MFEDRELKHFSVHIIPEVSFLRLKQKVRGISCDYLKKKKRKKKGGKVSWGFASVPVSTQPNK